MAVMINPLDPEFQQNPYPKYAELRAEAPVFRHPAGFVAVSTYAEVLDVLKSPERFSSKAMGGMEMPKEQRDLNPSFGSLIGKDPPDHTRMRNIVNRGFTPRRMAKLEPRIRQVIDELFAEFEKSGECDITRDLASPMPVIMIAELLGLDTAMRHDFKRWAHALMIGGMQAMADPQARARNLASVREFSHFMQETVAERRKKPGEDLISLLIDAEEQAGMLSPDEVVGFASLLLFAGSETTTNLVGNALLALFEHPETFERVRSDRSLVPALLEETLRWDSPIQLVMRLCVEETEVGGVSISKGAMVMPMLASANRDDRQFPKGEQFDIDRDTQGHLGLGFGNHFCLGASLARLQARLAFDAILERLPGLRPATDEPIQRHGALLVRGPQSVPVRFDA